MIRRKFGCGKRGELYRPCNISRHITTVVRSFRHICMVGGNAVARTAVRLPIRQAIKLYCRNSLTTESYTEHMRAYCVHKPHQAFEVAR